jgi:hypothetical protein
MAAFFEVQSAIRLEVIPLKDSHGLIRTVSEESIKDFKNRAIARRHGVFVFAIQKQGGGPPTPWYVGLAKKQAFADEAMSGDKLRKYAAALFGRIGRPVISLVAAPARGPKTPIDDLETLLIWMARARNSSLINERKINSDPKELIRLVNRIAISGVLNKGQGKPSNAATEFQRMMGLI